MVGIVFFGENVESGFVVDGQGVCFIFVKVQLYFFVFSYEYFMNYYIIKVIFWCKLGVSLVVEVLEVIVRYGVKLDVFSLIFSNVGNLVVVKIVFVFCFFVGKNGSECFVIIMVGFIVVCFNLVIVFLIFNNGVYGIGVNDGIYLVQLYICGIGKRNWDVLKICILVQVQFICSI